jgi:hypothetical protein
MQLPSQPVKASLHWPSLIQLILSLLTAFILFGASVVIVLSEVFQIIAGQNTLTDSTESFMIATSLAFAGILVLPSAWYAWKHIAHSDPPVSIKPEPRGFGLVLTIIVIVVMAGTLLFGNQIALNSNLNWLLLPPLNIVATGLPALWVIYMGSHGLIQGAPKRSWGVFASGLVAGPFIILVLELVLLVFIGILAILWAMLNPNLANLLNGLILRIQNPGSNPESIVRSLMPFILNPGILFLGFTFVSVLVPLLEEALKPIGVWLLAGQKLSPAQGFGYGVLSGAGFGLFENLGNTSGGTADWALLASSRISTLLLHSFTAGLVGWALASAWSERRYMRLAVTYILTVILHGLWNALALLSLGTELEGITNISLPTSLQQAGSLSIYGITVLGVMVIFLYFGANAYFRRNLTTGSFAFPAGSQALDTNANHQPALPSNEVSQLASKKTAGEDFSSGVHPAGVSDQTNPLAPNQNSTTGKER